MSGPAAPGRPDANGPALPHGSGHDHGHDHRHGSHAHAGHDHAGHDHSAHAPADERRLFWALVLTGGFMLVEVVGGALAGSLALIADAGHMLTDAAALGLSWFALRIARRPAGGLHSYGQHRARVLAAFVNGASLIAIAAWIAVEAVRRLFDPVGVLGGPMLAVAATGLAVNIVVFAMLHGGSREDLNIRGAMLHVAGDILGSIGAIAAAAVILATGWTPIDPILSVAVAALIVRNALDLVMRSWHILMEGAPVGLDVAGLRDELARAVPGVLDIHHVHVWSLTPERPLVTLHATVAGSADTDRVLRDIQRTLADRFGLTHATVQIEREGCAAAP